MDYAQVDGRKIGWQGGCVGGCPGQGCWMAIWMMGQPKAK